MTRFTFFSTAVIFYFIFSFSVWGQTLLEENFDYPAGDTLINHEWTQARNGSPVTIHDQGLEYPNYDMSGIGNAARIYAAGAQEVKKSFTEVSVDSLYLSFLVNVLDAASTISGGLFLYLTPPDGNIFSNRATVYVKKDDSDNIAFGVSIGSGIKYSTFDYNLNTTYLLIVKYKFDPDTTDELSFWINPDITKPESEPVRIDNTGDELPSIAEIIISQLTASNNPLDAILDGIKITTAWPIAEVTGIQNVAEPVQAFKLYQNYPNPFNPTTVINYQLPMTSDVDLSVYNLIGQKVAVLVNKKQAAGNYAITFNASRLSAGVYFYRLNSGHITLGRQMILIK